MLALKKKREAEAKAAAEEAARAKEEPASAENGAGKTEKVSLFGIGGQKKNKNGDGKTGKKRSPGEIRIQKGKLRLKPIVACSCHFKAQSLLPRNFRYLILWLAPQQPPFATPRTRREQTLPSWMEARWQPLVSPTPTT